MIRRLHELGFRSEFAYIGAFASIALSILAWAFSRRLTDDDKSQSDRWGIFIGHWAPTFFGLGIALKLEERSDADIDEFVVATSDGEFGDDS